ncbi:hypothetical protein [Desulfogranum marinum]|uniref:hypothetical protein n=1 Tax=Desulfogranum marinum TaxID=453220 RepID=UPI0029C7444F|nr:hypothetical protein [Desulfogranum marinum]
MTNSMIKVTTSAITILKRYLDKKQDTHAVRIDLVSLGSNWKSLALRLDSPRRSDLVYRYDEVTFLVEPALLTACGSIKIDYSPSDLRMSEYLQGGFSISSQTPLSSPLK